MIAIQRNFPSVAEFQAKKPNDEKSVVLIQRSNISADNSSPRNKGSSVRFIKETSSFSSEDMKRRYQELESLNREMLEINAEMKYESKEVLKSDLEFRGELLSNLSQILKQVISLEERGMNTKEEGNEKVMEEKRNI